MLSKEQWQRVEAAFDEAVELDGNQRQTFIQQFSSDHPNLASRLKQLLEADQQDIDLQAPIAAGVQSLTTEQEDPWLGKDVGAWTIVERIAAGGMGAVFLAERNDDQYQQRAAVKIMTAQLLADDALSRFRAERQILASLNHRFIAKLLDGGSTDTRLPYLVMEYVEGLPIDQHCDTQQLDLNARLKLFTRVCEAVDFAHRNLIVHRDLKPSNILVREDGEPRLLDFGIAKLIDGAQTDGTMVVTRQGMRVMTPEYASPEQVLGKPITIATDIYALGVLLYRLLSGRHPYAASLTTSVASEKAICHVDPRPPSTRAVAAAASSDDDTTDPTHIAAARQTTPPRLQRELRGDLDNIVLKALRKEPEQRYASMSHFADDIERYLRQEPVRAHTPSWRYRTAKFVRRNAAAVTAGILAATLFFTTIAFYTVRVTRERDRAQIEAEKAAQVAQFVAGLFKTASPDESLGEVITARALLDQGQQRLGDLDTQPAVQAQLQAVMAEAYRGLGLYQTSEGLYERAQQTRSNLLGAEHPDTLETTGGLASVLSVLGEFERSETLFRDALEKSTRVHGARSAETAKVLHGLALTLSSQSRFDEAGEKFVAALGIFEAIEQGDSLDKAALLDDYGRFLSDIGQPDRAIETLNRTIAMFKRLRGDVHPSYLNAMQNLGYTYLDEGKPKEAESVLQNMSDLSLQIYGDAHPFTVGCLATLATVYYTMGDYERAERMYRDALEGFEDIFGEYHPETSIGANNLATALQKLGRYDDAEHYYRLGLERNKAIHDGDHIEVATSYSNLGVFLMREGKIEDAEEPIREGLAMRQRILGFDHPDTMTSVSIFANFLLSTGEREAARAMRKQVVDYRRDRLGPDHPLTAREIGRYAILLRRDRDLAQSQALFEESIAIQRRVYPDGHQEIARNLLELGHTHQDAGHVELAERYYREALEQYETTLGATHPEVARALLALGTLLVRSERATEAADVLDRAKTIRSAHFAIGDWRLAEVDSALGLLGLALGRCDDARELLSRSYSALLAARGNRHPFTLAAGARVTEPCLLKTSLE
ncbi:MAG: tetratricopeptide repeat protein [Gammaproteobacteria bacterium]